MSSNYKSKSKQSDIDPVMAIGIFFMVIGYLWWNKNSHKVEVWYFEYFENIYLGVYAVMMIILFCIVRIVKKKTQKMDERALLLSPLWNKSNESIGVGKTIDGVELNLSDESRCSHVQVIGTTGSGKSKSVVIPWSIRDIKRGKSVVIIDGKGEQTLPEEIFKTINHIDVYCSKRHFDLGNINGSIRVNPLMHGSSQQITDRIFSSFEFEDPYYRSIQYDICGYLISLIKATDQIVTFRLLYELLTDDVLLQNTLCEIEDCALKTSLKNYLREPAKERRNKLSGLVSQISPFAIGEVSELVNNDSSPMYDALIRNFELQCLIFSIPTLKYQKLGHQLGKMLLQELSWCVSQRESIEDKKFTSVFLDEFSEFAYDEFISVLNKARSAEVALHLCHQSIGDLTKVSEPFARAVNTNTNVKCVLGLNDPETADFYARHFGTITKQKLTEQVKESGWFKNKEETGRGSMREVEEYRVHPNVLKELYQGNGVIHLPTTRGTVTERLYFSPIHYKELDIA